MSAERFEIRVETETLDAVDEWRRRQPGLPGRTEAARQLLHLAMDRKEGQLDELTQFEKLSIYMLADLQSQSPDENTQEFGTFVKRAIETENVWAITHRFTGIFSSSELPPLVSWVYSVMTMWWEIENSYEALSQQDKERLEAENVSAKFIGFGANHEGEEYGIATFIVHHLHKYQCFKDRDLNAHFPMKQRYELMLVKFEEINRGGLCRVELSADNLIHLLS